jgi:hypothetical protein
MRRIVCTVLLCGSALPLIAQDCHKILGKQKPDAASIKQAEDRWSQAYTQGRTEYLECLLTPDYVSVSAKGVPRDKAAIVSGAQKNAQQNKGKTDGKSKTLPDLPEPKIQLYGNSAVVQSSLAADPNGKYPAMYSSDVFAFQDGVWRAIYSQHTPVETKE